VAAAREAMLGETEDEYRRLLYVAMTRAADRLIVGGCLPGNVSSVRKYSWYDLTGKGLENSGLHVQTFEASDGSVVKRYSRPEDAVAVTGAAAGKKAPALELPSWLHQAASRGTSAEALLRPSGPAGDEVHLFRNAESVQSRAHARRRGTLVHRLLQSLPDVGSRLQREATLNFLARNAADWSDGERDSLTEQVLSLIGDPR